MKDLIIYKLFILIKNQSAKDINKAVPLLTQKSLSYELLEPGLVVLIGSMTVNIYEGYFYPVLIG